jgi:hypothetical protein
MGADLASENDPDNHRDSGGAIGFPIPSPRPAPDDHIENLPDIGSDNPVWQYDQPRKRGNNRCYTGHVDRIGGTEGDRLRGDLAAIISDLLDWAKQQTESDAESTSNTEANRESREDGGVE